MPYPPSSADALASEEAGEALLNGRDPTAGHPSGNGHASPAGGLEERGDEEEEIIDEVRYVPVVREYDAIGRMCLYVSGGTRTSAPSVSRPYRCPFS